MNDGLIPNRYAKALYKLAVDKGEDTAVYNEMKQLDASYASVAELKSTVDNPFVDAEHKQQVIITAAGAAQGGSLHKFTALVVKNNRSNYMRAIALAYIKLYREQHNIARVEIVTAAPMSEQAVNELVDVVKRRRPEATLELSTKVDESLLGGFKIAVDSSVLDASVKNELEKLRLKLLS